MNSSPSFQGVLSRWFINIAGVIFMLAGASVVYLLLYDAGRFSNHPLFSHPGYLMLSAYFCILGVGVLCRLQEAYRSAKSLLIVLFLGFIVLSLIAALLIVVIANNPLELIKKVAVLNLLVFVFAAGIWLYALRSNLAEKFCHLEKFRGGKLVETAALIAGIVCINLCVEAAGGENPIIFVATHMSWPELSEKRTSDGVALVTFDSSPKSLLSRAPSPPPAPQEFDAWEESVTVTKTGEVFWLDFSDGNQLRGTQKGHFWNPTTGELRHVKFPTTILSSSIIATPQGLLFAGGQRGLPSQKVYENKLVTDEKVTLLTPENNVITAKLEVPRANPAMLALSDTQVLVAGGVVAWGESRRNAAGHTIAAYTKAVELVTISANELSVERLPDLPIAGSAGFSLVMPADGKVMVLGGTASKYIGCWDCSADTYILDMKTRRWIAGPRMIEPRAYAAAALLPDGSVLVTGGWTPAQDWQVGASHTTERWDPHSNTFSAFASLPAGSASLRAFWAPGQTGKHLLFAGGTSGAVQDFDVENSRFLLVGEGRGRPIGSVRLEVVPVSHNGEMYLWQLFDRSQLLIKLRWPSTTQNELATADFDRQIYRPGFAFIPPAGGAPGLVLGGTVHSGQPADYITAGVDAIWSDGRITPLPPLNYAQKESQAFRMQNGSVLVIGGKQSNKSTPSPMHLEWMASINKSSEGKWVTLNESTLDSCALGQLADGRLVSVGPSGAVHSISVMNETQDTPTLKAEALPSLPVHGDNFTVKEVADGRIIVTGGVVPSGYIALLPENPSDNNAADNYVPIGPEVPVDTYQIYDPQKQKWHSSGKHDYSDGQIAILNDGRVVAYHNFGMKISSTDGNLWNDLPIAELGACLNTSTSKLFSLDGELFLSGKCESRNPNIVLWFDFSTMHWIKVWSNSPDDERRDWVYENGGNEWLPSARIISRQLPNGKRVMFSI